MRAKRALFQFILPPENNSNQLANDENIIQLLDAVEFGEQLIDDRVMNAR